MADNSELNLLAPGALEEVKQAYASVKDLGDLIVEVNGKLKAGELKIQGADKISALNTTIREAATSMDVLTAANKLYTDSAGAIVKINDLITQSNKKRGDNAQSEIEKQIRFEERLTKKLEADLRKRLSAVEASAKAEQRIVDELNNEYGQLSKAYNETALRAKNLQLQLGANHPVAQQAVSDAVAMSETLKKLDASVGQHQRNVGNYNMVGAQFAQILRELPNAGISLNTFLISITNNLSYFVESIRTSMQQGASWKAVLAQMGTALFGVVGVVNLLAAALPLLGKIIEDYNKKQDQMAEYSKKVADEGAKEIVHMQLLKREVDDNNTSHTRLVQIRDELVRQFPNLQKDLSNESTLREDLAKAIDRGNQALILQTQIRAAEEILVEGNKKMLKGELDAYEKFIAVISSGGGVTSAIMALSNAHTQSFIDIKKTSEMMFKIIDESRRKLREGGFEDLFNPKSGADSTKEADKLAQLRLSSSKALTEEEARRAELNAREAAENAKQVLSDENIYYEDRLSALTTYLNATTILYEISYEKRKQDLQDEQKQQIELAHGSTEAIAEINKTFRSKQENEDLIYQQNITKLYQDGTKQRNDIVRDGLNDEYRYRIDSLTRIAQQVDDDYQKDLIALAESLDKKKISIRTYEIQRQQIEYSYAIQRLQAQADYLKEELSLFEGSADQRADLERRLNIILNQLAQARVKNAKADAAADMDEWKRRLGFVQKIASEINNIFSSLGDALKQGNDSKIEALNFEAETTQKNAELEIANIKRSQATEEEKQAAIRYQEGLTANARQKATLDQRRIKQQEARFDKVANISRIITSGAVAALEPFTQFPFPVAAAFAAIIGGLTAVQLATAIAAPIPQYAKGTDKHKGGAFIAGDGGERELVQHPDGTAYWTGDNPAVYSAPAGTRVIPESKLASSVANLGMSNIMRRQQTGQVFDTRNLERAINRMNTTVNNHIEVHTDNLKIRVSRR